MCASLFTERIQLKQENVNMESRAAIGGCQMCCWNLTTDEPKRVAVSLVHCNDKGFPREKQIDKMLIVI